MKSVKSSFDANVLETLCEVCWGVEQSRVTDDFLLEKIHEITDSFQNQELPDVKELFREELRMNIFFEEERGTKEKCKLIVCSLPKGLKSKVQNELDYRVPEAKCNSRKLYELVRVKAKEQAIEERALKKANPPRHNHEKKEHKHGPQHNKRRNEQQDHRVVKKVNTGKDTDRRQQKGGQSGRAAAKGAPKSGCFHCGGPRYLSKCPTATPAEREKLLTDRKQDNKGDSTDTGRHR
ncbi:hypothetical protein PF004_g26682 [Phytophthora fragariae]|uniref:Uncharacterized protein n=1 Tax=Phytophthora fragariae TaxID=53985 RepID=A0A6G0MMZ5_9STRA|nr:hypothetical protein PF004_g26682 [Phytophthora fragariae]